MNLFRSGLAPRIGRYLRHRLAPRALILMYHRVAELPTDPQLLAVTPRRFGEQLALLSKLTQPMSLGELCGRLRAGRLPRRAVAITFDDGYADNLYEARPLLQRYGVPATVFVASGHIGSQQEFWWDELERLTLQPERLPARLALEVGGVSLDWANASAENGDRQPGHQDWHIERPDDPGPREELYRRLYGALHDLPAAERDKALERVRIWAGASPAGRPSHRTMSADELARLAAGGLVEVGAHTVSHPPLATLPPEQQVEEIERSKLELEQLLGHKVASFAYPHGSYNHATIAAVRAAGFACACSSDTDATWRDAPLLRLPRVVVRNWDSRLFRRWLGGWFGD